MSLRVGDATDITPLLTKWSQGNREALDRVLPLVYSELRKIAGTTASQRGRRARARPNRSGSRAVRPTGRSATRHLEQPRPVLRHDRPDDATDTRRLRTGPPGCQAWRVRRHPVIDRVGGRTDGAARAGVGCAGDRRGAGAIGEARCRPVHASSSCDSSPGCRSTRQRTSWGSRLARSSATGGWHERGCSASCSEPPHGEHRAPPAIIPLVMLTDDTRRRFLATFSSVGLGSTLAPGVLWARMQDAGVDRVTLAMVTDALKLSGIELADDDREALVDSANTNLERLDELRAFHIPNDVSPPYHFSPVVAGMKVDKTRLPWVLSKAPALKRPARLEDVAFWPLRHLAELVRTRQVSSVELTRMYLERLHRYNSRLNNVVTFLDDHGLAEAASCRSRHRRRSLQGPAARPALGLQGHHHGEGLQDDLGLPGIHRAAVRLRRQRRRDAARRRRRADCQARHRRARRRRQLVRRPDQEPVGSDAGLERLIGGPGVGHGGRLRRLCHRHRDERVDSEPGGALRRRRPAADVRPHQPLTAPWPCRGRRIGSGRSAATPRTAPW